jgi:hypothetical protein
MSEIQYVQVQSEQTFETFRINVTNPDSKTYKLAFQNPTTLKYNLSSDIAGSASASSMRNAIKGYFSSTFGADIVVNLTMYDANGTNTTNSTNSTLNVYHVRLRKLITGKSVAGIMRVSTGSSSAVTFDLPEVVQLSAAPLSGRYRFKCVNEKNQTSYSSEISTGWSWHWVGVKLMESCAEMYDKVEVKEGRTYPYRQNGRSFFIRYIGKKAPMGLISIESGLVTPLTGTNITFYSNVSMPRSTNLFFDPLPFEWLKTYETAPQLLVTVGDYPAVCHNLSCDFKYTVPQGLVTAYTYSQANNRTLVLNGTQLPENSSLVRQVDFAHSPCDIVSIDHYSSNGTVLNLTDLAL